LLKENGTLEIILGYAQEFEPTETKRLNLPPITLGLINDIIVPAFEDKGFHAKEFYEMSKKKLADVETTWAKKLRFGKDRKIYKIKFSFIIKKITTATIPIISILTIGFFQLIFTGGSSFGTTAFGTSTIGSLVTGTTGVPSGISGTCGIGLFFSSN
jgi:hypothetical protein